MWRLKFTPGTLKAVSRKDGKMVLTQEIKTAGKPARILLTADRQVIKADGKDLSFITAKVLDKDGNLVPETDNLIHFTVAGNAFIAGTDNGDPVDHNGLKNPDRKAFHGLAMAIIQAENNSGTVKITATAAGFANGKRLLCR